MIKFQLRYLHSVYTIITEKCSHFISFELLSTSSLFSLLFSLGYRPYPLLVRVLFLRCCYNRFRIAGLRKGFPPTLGDITGDFSPCHSNFFGSSPSCLPIPSSGHELSVAALIGCYAQSCHWITSTCYYLTNLYRKSDSNAHVTKTLHFECSMATFSSFRQKNEGVVSTPWKYDLPPPQALQHFERRSATLREW